MSVFVSERFAFCAGALSVTGSNVRPSSSVGVTVTDVPFTLTSRKWCTRSFVAGTGAAPQALPIR